MVWSNKPFTDASQLSELDKLFPSLRLVKSSRKARRMAKWLGILLLLVTCITAFAPWQQFVAGSGRVVAFDPLLREQVVQAPISGRVTRWADGMREGIRVKQGQMIVEIRDLDPNLLARLEEQIEATERELESLKQVARAYEAQVEAFRIVKQQVVSAADEYVKMSEQKLKAELQNYQSVEAARLQIEADYKRQKLLAQDGLASTFKHQVARRKLQEALAKVEQAKAYIASARNGVNAKNNEREAKEREAQAKIDSATAQLRKAQGDVAKTQKTLLDLRVKLTRQQSQVVTAPWDGFIFKLDTFQQGAIVKQGDPLFTLVPETAERAVEIWLDGNDASWVTTGQHVRLQFEGWPGIQFVGWPSIAINTFGGVVAVVDSTDNGKGQFRILIRPDPNDKQWPSDRFLRQGVLTNGLVMLKQVPLWFELWRQFNGFPPVVDIKPNKKKTDGKIIKKLK